MLSERSRKDLIRILNEVRTHDTQSWGETELWKGRTIKALNTVLADADRYPAHAYRIQAQKARHVDGDLEIDNDATVSVTELGAYVQAWVWVGKEDVEWGLTSSGT
jgi:hypothetical protein